MGNTFRQYWHTWLWRDAVTKLITVNTLVWLCAAVALLLAGHQAQVARMLSMPSGLHALAMRPWTVITYMFTQYDFMHLLVNMMWLLLFGRLFLVSQSGLHLTTLYVYGGLAGALAFILCHPAHQYLTGASCAVLAVVCAATAMQPRWNVNLLIIGRVQVVWIAAAAVLFFIVLSESGVQSLAHAAGAAVGAAYGLLRKVGVDITAPVSALESVLSRRRVLTAEAPRRSGKRYSSAEEEMDALLDKVHLYGYSSLSAQQRQRLFDLSQKLKR